MKSLTDKQYAHAIQVIEKILEPKIKKLITSTNELLKKDGIVLGADIQWIADGVSEDNGENS